MQVSFNVVNVLDEEGVLVIIELGNRGGHELPFKLLPEIVLSGFFLSLLIENHLLNHFLLHFLLYLVLIQHHFFLKVVLDLG